MFMKRVYRHLDGDKARFAKSSDLNFAWRLRAGCWSMMKQAIGQGAADALVEENEQGSHAGPLFGEAVGVVIAVMPRIRMPRRRNR